MTDTTIITPWVPVPNEEPDLDQIWLELRDPEGWWKARLRNDCGCVDLWRYHNVPLQDRPSEWEHMELEDYLHICDVDDLIARLQALKVFAKMHFGDEWE